VLGVTGIDFRILDLRDLDEHRASLGLFDQIICFETIEHVVKDQELVNSLAGILRPGGRLFLTTPFDEHHPLFSEDRAPSATEDGSHVRYGYSPEQLRQIVQDAGLEVTSEAFVSGVISQKVTDLMRRLTVRFGLITGWVAVLPLRPLVLFDAPLTRMLRYPHLSVALSAVKPG
jgi:SAM-dependent methyltransferase